MTRKQPKLHPRPRTSKERAELAEEVRWLRSFGWSWQNIGDTLHISRPYAKVLGEEAHDD